MRNLLAQAAPTTINLKPTSGAGLVASDFTVQRLLVAVISIIMGAAALIFFIMLVIGGIRWMLSGGDKGQTEAARGQITAGLIGLVIVFAAYAIATLIGNIFGFNIFALVIPNI